MLGSGISSLAIWTPFDSTTTATVRTLKARVLVAWTRVQTVNSFAIIGTSLIGGTDIVQGVGDNVLNNADLYQYFDETARVLRIEYERHLIEPLGGAAIAMATILLDNNDLRFTPNYNATIGTALKPNRPIKIFIGFDVGGQEVTVPIIEALSLQPKEDKNARTLTIQAQDFVSFLDGIPQDTAVYQDKRTDQIIADILASAGIGSSNYTLDAGINTPAFVGFGVGDYVGTSIKQLVEAEEGIFYQDEQGQFRFDNRLKSASAPYTVVQWTINPEDILEWEVQDSSQIINHMLISGKPRSVKGEVEIWRDGVEEIILPNQSLTIWAQFNDPVTTIAAPEATLDFQAFNQTAGAGSDVTAHLSFSVTSFSTTAKIVITNSGSDTAYLNLFRLRGTPATVDFDISETYEDGTSVSLYNVQQQQITNNFIQSADFAKTLAKNIVNRYKDPTDILQLKIRGVPQLQLRDKVQVKDPDLGTYKDYRIIGIAGVFEPGSFTQTLTLRLITSAETI